MNIKKLTIFVLIFIVILTFFTGCVAVSSDTAKSQSTVTEENKGFGFETVYYSARQLVYREITTDVLYFYSESASGGGLAVMLNPETGKPLTYSDWKANYEK